MSYEIKGTVIIDDDRKIVGANTYNGYVPVNPTLTIAAANGLVGGGNLTANRSFYVRAGDGISVNSTGVHVVGAAGIATNTSSVFLDSTWMKPRYVNIVSAEGVANTIMNNIGMAANTLGATIFYHTQDGRPTDAPGNGQGAGLVIGSTMWTTPAMLHFTNGPTGALAYSTPNSILWKTVASTDDLVGFANSNVQIIAGSGLTGGGVLTANRTLTVGQGDGIVVNATNVAVDSTVVRTTGNQTIGGTKTFSASILEVSGTAGNPSYSFTSDTNTGVFLTGTGSIGISTAGALAAVFTNTGNLRLYNTGGTFYTEIANQPTANRVLTLPDGNVVLVTGTMVPNSIQVIAGNGLSGGGTLAANRTLAVVAGDGVAVNSTAVGVDSTVVRTTRTFTAGAGLTGGGDLTANRTFAVGQGDGITVATTTVGVDSTVVRTTGDQTIAGFKTFSSAIAGSVTGSAASLTTGRTLTIGSTGKTFNGTANVAWTLTEIGAAPTVGSTSITTLGTITTGVWNAGAITSSGTIAAANGTAAAPAFDFTSNPNTGMYLSAADTLSFATNGAIAASFTSTGNLRLYNTGGTFFNEFSSQPTANRTLTLPDANVVLVAGTMVPNSIQVIAGNGLTGGGTLAANRTFAVGQGDGITVAATTVGVDATVVRTTGDQTIAGFKTFSSEIRAGFVDGVRLVGAAKSLIHRMDGATYWVLIADTPTGTNNALRPISVSMTTGVVSMANGLNWGNVAAVGNGASISSLNGTNITTGTVADARIASTLVRTARTVTAGNGLTGGGDLSANRAFAVGQGDGITVAATTVGVDSTVVRTTGDQAISGIKTVTGRLRATQAPAITTDVTNKAYVDEQVAGAGWELWQQIDLVNQNTSWVLSNLFDLSKLYEYKILAGPFTCTTAGTARIGFCKASATGTVFAFNNISNSIKSPIHAVSEISVGFPSITRNHFNIQMNFSHYDIDSGDQMGGADYGNWGLKSSTNTQIARVAFSGTVGGLTGSFRIFRRL